ncbi:MAG TPA: DUF1656 domain-containing protein [Gemmatimonadaceae bacterium]|nr:DUF1656 domain-containing protein [Gemmatimonadaceae bacterium]
MTGEVSFFGVYVPALLVAALGAGVVLIVLRRLLARLGVYRWVWHRTLVDVALYVILVGLTVQLVARPARATDSGAPPAAAPSTHSLSVGSAPTTR